MVDRRKQEDEREVEKEEGPKGVDMEERRGNRFLILHLEILNGRKA